MAGWVALLGTKGGPAIRTGSPSPTSSVVMLGGRWVVVDCGLGVTRGLVEQGLPLRDLSLILVTHLHSDHYLELGPLVHTAWTAGLKTPVTIWGPAGLEQSWRAFCLSLAADIDLRIADEGRPDLRELVSFGVIGEGLVTQDAGLAVHALPAIHPPFTEAWSLSVRGAGRHVVFSGDTAPNPALAGFARGADLLVHEAMLTEGVEALLARVGNGDTRLRTHILASHTAAADAARVAAQAGVGALALHHLIPADDPAFGPADWHRAVAPHWSGSLHLGTDGLRIGL